LSDRSAWGKTLDSLAATTEVSPKAPRLWMTTAPPIVALPGLRSHWISRSTRLPWQARRSGFYALPSQVRDLWNRAPRERHSFLGAMPVKPIKDTTKASEQ
jgi:hypothetical protein